MVVTTLQNSENNALCSRMTSRRREATSRCGEATSRREEATLRHGKVTSRRGLLLTDFSCSSCPDFFHLLPRDNLSLGAMK